jgi:tetratricopeptide (TPR) repeat protein
LSPAASPTSKTPDNKSAVPPMQDTLATSKAKEKTPFTTSKTKKTKATEKKKAPPKNSSEQSYQKVNSSISVLMAEKSPLHIPRLKGLFADFQLSNVTYTGDGYRAISYAKEKKFDLIFIGQTLSNVNGTSVLESLREASENIDTPVVYLWEGVEKTLLDKATSLGANAFLQKPVEEVHFRKVFELTLHKYVVSFDDERERANEAMKPMVMAADFARNIRLQGDYDAAEEAFRNGLMELFCGLAEVYLSKGNPSYANRVIVQAEKIDPSARKRFDLREETFIERGLEYIKQKWHDGAVVEFEAALALNEESIPALVGLGQALQMMGKTEKADEIYERAINAKVMQDDREIFTRFGTLALRNQNFNVATRAFDKAIMYYPQIAINYYNKSLIYVLQKQWDKVIPLLKKALTIEPGFKEAQAMLQKAQNWQK